MTQIASFKRRRMTMANVDATVQEAEKLGATKDEHALELELGMRDEAIKKDPALENKPDLKLEYAKHMGLIDDLKATGRRIAVRWSKELYTIVCEQGADTEDRKRFLDALNLGEVAVIGATATALIGMGVLAPIAAAASPLIVKRFIWPAKDELCEGWREAFAAE
jgi:hypothetical protein